MRMLDAVRRGIFLQEERDRARREGYESMKMRVRLLLEMKEIMKRQIDG